MKLDQVFKEFIHVVQENPDYILGLLDKENRIISCSLEKEIGRKVEIDGKDPGCKIYEVIVSDTTYGRLLIKGPEQTIGVVGSILYDSLKTRIQYELNQQSAKDSLSVDDQLLKELLNGEHLNYGHIEELMKKIDFNSGVPRVPIFIVNDAGFDRDEITSLKYKINDRNTIYSLLNSHNLVIFKSIPKEINDKNSSEYIHTFIHELIEWGLSDCYYTVGTIQLDLDLYSFSYKNCLWLKDNVMMSKDTPVFFEDNIFVYLAANSAKRNIAHIFDYYRRQASMINIEEFIDIVEHLYTNDFSIKKTAETMFLHKNTLLYKIKRYEEMFNVNIRGSFQGKMLVCYLATILKNDKSRKQVGEK